MSKDIKLKLKDIMLMSKGTRAGNKEYKKICCEK